MSSALTTTSLKSIVTEFWDLLCNKKDFEAARKYMHPDITTDHYPYPLARGEDTVISAISKAFQLMPNFKIDVRDIIAEVDDTGVGGGKVWTFSILTGAGPNGEVKYSVDMATVDKDGKVTSVKDVQCDIKPGDENK